MKTMTYGLKFALDRAVALSKRITEQLGISPARFDVLHALHDATERVAPRQRWFSERLGISALSLIHI